MLRHGASRSLLIIVISSPQRQTRIERKQIPDLEAVKPELKSISLLTTLYKYLEANPWSKAGCRKKIMLASIARVRAKANNLDLPTSRYFRKYVYEGSRILSSAGCKNKLGVSLEKFYR